MKLVLGYLIGGTLLNKDSYPEEIPRMKLLATKIVKKIDPTIIKERVFGQLKNLWNGQMGDITSNL